MRKAFSSEDVICFLLSAMDSFLQVKGKKYLFWLMVPVKGHFDPCVWVEHHGSGSLWQRVVLGREVGGAREKPSPLADLE